MKKRDPEAQGGAFERRKMHEEGAGLFVAPMMPEKANREVAKTTRKSAGKGWFDLPAAGVHSGVEEGHANVEVARRVRPQKVL